MSCLVMHRKQGGRKECIISHLATQTAGCLFPPCMGKRFNKWPHGSFTSNSLLFTNARCSFQKKPKAWRLTDWFMAKKKEKEKTMHHWLLCPLLRIFPLQPSSTHLNTVTATEAGLLLSIESMQLSSFKTQLLLSTVFFFFEVLIFLIYDLMFIFQAGLAWICCVKLEFGANFHGWQVGWIRRWKFNVCGHPSAGCFVFQQQCGDSSEATFARRHGTKYIPILF